jgi:hypothetical protein
VETNWIVLMRSGSKKIEMVFPKFDGMDQERWFRTSEIT